MSTPCRVRECPEWPRRTKRRKRSPIRPMTRRRDQRARKPAGPSPRFASPPPSSRGATASGRRPAWWIPRDARGAVSPDSPSVSLSPRSSLPCSRIAAAHRNPRAPAHRRPVTPDIASLLVRCSRPPMLPDTPYAQLINIRML